MRITCKSVDQSVPGGTVRMMLLLILRVNRRMQTVEKFTALQLAVNIVDGLAPAQCSEL
ncbi:MAG: hypothetical protein R3E64_12555 [Halioglobus sp.]